MAPDGHVLIAERTAQRVTKRSLKSGAIIWSKVKVGTPHGATELRDQFVVITDSNNTLIRVYDKAGAEIWRVDAHHRFQDVGVTTNGNAIIPIKKKINGKDAVVLTIFSPKGKKLREIPLDANFIDLSSVRPAP